VTVFYNDADDIVDTPELELIRDLEARLHDIEALNNEIEDELQERKDWEAAEEEETVAS
jgi:hypothetical protein